jgi:hypothetical protein
VRGVIPTLPQYIFLSWYSVEHRENFTFTTDRLNGIRETNKKNYDNNKVK